MIPTLGLPGIPLSRSFYSPLRDRYTGKGTRALGTADSGQSWWMVDNHPDARLRVISGKLTNVKASGVSAGYVEINAGRAVARIGGRFTLSAGDGGGVAVFVVFQTMLQQVASIPNAGCHLTVGKDSWNYGVWESGIGLTSIANGVLALVADDTTPHTVDVTFSGATATILIDAVEHTATDARIASLAGPYPCFEVYQNDAAVDGKPKFLNVWINT